jgi:hypothetical protein
MAYITLYFTSGDTQVEPVGDGVGSPVSFTLRADQNEVGSWKGLYATATSGYVCSGVSVYLSGTTATKWQFTDDDGGGSSPNASPEAYGDPIAIGQVEAVTKNYFHVRAKATDDETPTNDTSVSLVCSGIAYAA